MAELKEIAEFLEKELKNSEVDEKSNNGIQVETRKDIKKIGFAVDGCIDVFEKAKDEGCDLVIVHHGISWHDNLKRITENNYDRISFLIKNDIGLYASHLPLDLHMKHGNNAEIARILGLKKVIPFGMYDGINVGVAGELKEKSIDEFYKDVEEKLGSAPRMLKFGKDKVKRVCIVSGGGSSCIYEAIAKDYDVFITGEAPHNRYHDAKEGKMNMILAGHYVTETFGVKALMPLLEKKFKVETVFLDVPTGF